MIIKNAAKATANPATFKMVATLKRVNTLMKLRMIVFMTYSILLLHDLGTVLGIQITRWLIGQDHIRVGDYRLFILDTMYRILVRRMPVLEGDSQYRDNRDKSEGYQINPPIHRGLISEIL